MIAAANEVTPERIANLGLPTSFQFMMGDCFLRLAQAAKDRRASWVGLA
jgi:hypothetical protein